MAEESLFKPSDIAIVIATIAGPIIAVQTQKWIERARERRSRQVAVFEALMATRGSRLAPRHVDALNAIPIAFYGKGTKLAKIRTEWNDYLAHLSDEKKREANISMWVGEQTAKFVSLLHEMAQFCGYSLTKQEIEKIYSPMAHATLEAEQNKVLTGVARILEGQAALPILVRNFPESPSSNS